MLPLLLEGMTDNRSFVLLICTKRKQRFSCLRPFIGLDFCPPIAYHPDF